MCKYSLLLYLLLFCIQKDVFSQLLHNNDLKFTKGTYASPPLLSNGTIDYPKLIEQLKDIHANTYHWLASGKNSDINALKEFLPLVQAADIHVWVTLLPPSESPPLSKNFSEPFQLDYVKWATELAQLSLIYKNLVAWSIDDFPYNLKIFTPVYVKQFTDAAKAINPAFAFVPCCYYKMITKDFVAKYEDLFDGVLFPYRNESLVANLKDAAQVPFEIEHIRSLFTKPVLIFLDVYATAHSTLGSSMPQYVQAVIEAGLKSADGIFIYCHQNPERLPDKYEVIKKEFKRKFKQRHSVK